MNRVLLVNLVEEYPERDHISKVDRAAGDLFFASFGLEYAGYILVEGVGCLAAQWIVPDDKLDAVMKYVSTNDLDGYEVRVFAGVEQDNGSMMEERVL